MSTNDLSRRKFLSHAAALTAGWALSDGRTLGAAPLNFSPVTPAPAPARADLPLKILTTGNIPPEYAKKITGLAPGIEIITARGAEEVAAKIAEADVFYGSPSARLIAAAKRLKWVQVGSAGVENYGFPELVKGPIILTNSSGVYGSQISEHAIGLMLALTRGINRFIATKAWRVDDLKPIEISGMTMGIVGLGDIGSQIARRAHYGFDMKILATDPKPMRKPGFVAELRYPSWFMAMVPQVDFLVSAAPHTRETEKMFNAKVFNAMKPTAYFIDISRGKLIDGPALIQALKDQRIAGAGLDVTPEEPLPKDNPLWGFPNVIITGHTSGVCQYSDKRRMDLFTENVRRFVAGEPLLNVIDKEKGY